MKITIEETIKELTDIGMPLPRYDGPNNNISIKHVAVAAASSAFITNTVILGTFALIAKK